jgi:hypothetical protein
MQAFVQRHQAVVTGVLQGFDRVLFRGTLRSISYGDGVDRFLGAQKVKYQDFVPFVQRLSEKLKQHAEATARAAGRPFVYVSNSRVSKEDLAQEIARRDGITQGLICVLRCVEPCMSFSIRRDDHGHFRFMSQERKCLHLYFYYLDREFGLMHVRLATWLPFGIQVCVNGREYLARRMAQAGIGFEKRDNCFTRIDDLPRAQRFLDALTTRRWERFLQTLAQRVNPLPKQLDLFAYYWSLRESEYATDVMFKDAAALAKVYKPLVDYAIQHFSCHDVLRFLGRRTHPGVFVGEAASSLLERHEGIRIKHWAEENSLKMYDKQGSVLRVETTINYAGRFKVRRMSRHKGVACMRWLPMRMGLADLERRVEVSRAANERYLQALAVVDVPCPAKTLLDQVSRRVIKEHRPYRALRPVSQEEAKVFGVVLAGEFQVKGVTNRDLRKGLKLPEPSDPYEARQQSGRATRWLRLLRAHGLIGKVTGTRYYRVTRHGQHIMGAALRLRNTDVQKLAA